MIRPDRHKLLDTEILDLLNNGDDSMISDTLRCSWIRKKLEHAIISVVNLKLV